MSKQAAKGFVEKVKSDAELAGKITALGADLTEADMVRIAGEAGFECTADELDEIGKAMSSELDDAQLENVAGGAGTSVVAGSSSYVIKTGATGERSIIIVNGAGGDVQLKVKSGVQNLAYTAGTTKG